MSEGAGKMLAKLAEGIEVKCQHAVTKSDYSSTKVSITCANGKKFVADKVHNERFRTINTISLHQGGILHPARRV